MKIVREYLNEEFKQHSDPIADMGISRINFGEAHDEIMNPALKQWRKFLSDLVGKTLEGRMIFIGGYSGAKSKVKIAKVGTVGSSTTTIVIGDENGRSYTLINDEEYIIS